MGCPGIEGFCNKRNLGISKCDSSFGKSSASLAFPSTHTVKDSEKSCVEEISLSRSVQCFPNQPDYWSLCMTPIPQASSPHPYWYISVHSCVSHFPQMNPTHTNRDFQIQFSLSLSLPQCSHNTVPRVHFCLVFIKTHEYNIVHIIYSSLDSVSTMHTNPRQFIASSLT